MYFECIYFFFFSRSFIVDTCLFVSIPVFVIYILFGFRSSLVMKSAEKQNHQQQQQYSDKQIQIFIFLCLFFARTASHQKCFSIFSVLSHTNLSLFSIHFVFLMQTNRAVTTSETML